MTPSRCLPPLLAVGFLSACATPAPSHRFMAVPETGKTQVAFRHDIKSCHQQALASKQDAVPATHESTRPEESAGIWVVSSNSGFLQCMAAHGNAVAPAPEHASPYPGHAYLVRCPYGYFDPPYGAFDP